MNVLFISFAWGKTFGFYVITEKVMKVDHRKQRKLRHNTYVRMLLFYNIYKTIKIQLLFSPPLIAIYSSTRAKNLFIRF